MVELCITVETVIYDDGQPEEETMQEVVCQLKNTDVKDTHWEFSLNSTDYPDDDDIQTYVVDHLTDQGISWDTVTVEHL